MSFGKALHAIKFETYRLCFVAALTYRKALKVRIADLGAERSERPHPALIVEMCMSQHRSLSAQISRLTISVS